MTNVEDVTQLVLRERQSRDRGWWNEMAACFAPDAVVDMSWFKGSGAEFVRRTAKRSRDGAWGRHRLCPPVVRSHGDRAWAELPLAIEFRIEVGCVEADLVSHARSQHRCRREAGAWRIVRIRSIAPPIAAWRGTSPGRGTTSGPTCPATTGLTRRRSCTRRSRPGSPAGPADRAFGVGSHVRHGDAGLSPGHRAFPTFPSYAMWVARQPRSRFRPTIGAGRCTWGPSARPADAQRTLARHGRPARGEDRDRHPRDQQARRRPSRVPPAPWGGPTRPGGRP